MGTRCLLHIKDEAGITLVTLYRQYDGYPSGFAKDLKDILNDGQSRLVNGYTFDDKVPKAFNGMSCLAAYLIGELKGGEILGITPPRGY